MNVTTKGLFGILTVWTIVLCVAFGLVLKYFVLTGNTESRLNKVEQEIKVLAQQTAVTPKIVVIDLAKVANEWKGRNDNLAIKAVETTIKFYNEKGYLVLDSASVVGEIGKYSGMVPTPEKMSQMMRQVEGK
ncbi:MULTISPECIES: hypothetical protein [Vibrio]|uniref:hypothetical protein n=1 Tax=Vibrio TaxID=662 RepID=UPI0002F1855A|nr:MULTISPECIES: hypothetical protein [Vibrio]POC39262.1 hypothetical protein CRN55_08510 [Vibrio vulnificus]